MKSPYEAENPYQVRRLCERLAVQAVHNQGSLVPDLPDGVTREMSHTLAGRLRARGYITKPQYEIALRFRDAWREAYGDPEPHAPERGEPLARKKVYNPQAPDLNFKAIRRMVRLNIRNYNLLVAYFALDTDPVWLNGPRTAAHLNELVALKGALDKLMEAWR